ncbi:hypothetical protein Ptr902_10718 [Pyrenophora tritici-repentis]|uniref:Uncharacterized protein n=1 Tax=Pyrenophora tritici-repentis TaxID=45151 RepID=A0A5M9KUS3_9PLEO|nr:hypothetical protein PtrV1_09822 [Pyrenophora tritici-repentis]KAF7445776.1 hypothetical protein A1F99_090670 [Pyrenophora tritici-repentis]KAF7566900.1 hypothetical protein PtrM4_134910 [Pyrenophora tritici-repentis]KAI0570046.1 hypothetical protein Alg215_11296 [Pyrenophora tritici-repentis]KAI0571150.1 hypothetical protein Alg130_10983 [Pyrenophora tritici-repentis]
MMVNLQTVVILLSLSLGALAFDRCDGWAYEFGQCCSWTKTGSRYTKNEASCQPCNSSFPCKKGANRCDRFTGTRPDGIPYANCS